MTARTRRLAVRILLLALVSAAALPVAALAASGPPAPSPKAVSSSEPVVLNADKLDYDQAHNFVIAEGHVEVSQGQSVLLSDSLTYDQQNNIVFAQGNVSMLEPSGNVYFADDMELTGDMKTGVVNQFKARLADNSLLVADKATRYSEMLTKLSRAIYTPCLVVCDDGKTPKDPFWDIRAARATIDKTDQTITYHDAYMDMFGQPVLYTPYFSQAIPGADNKSGLLTPEFRRNSSLGEVFTIPAYWAISPDRDATLMPMVTTKASTVLFGEYRERFDEGRMIFDGSIDPWADATDIGGPDRSVRGHLFGKGNFDESSGDDWGFNIQRVTDQTYLRLYDISADPLLTTRLYGESFDYAGASGRNYAVAQTLAFQGMEATDNPRTTPLVLPLMDMYYETLPMAWNSRLSFTGDMMSLTRELGDDSRRLSGRGDWSIPYVTDSGQVFKLDTSLRTDVYDVNGLTLPDGQNFAGTAGRVVPQEELEWRYPLINRFSGSNMIIEPVAQAIVSPAGGNSVKIPNEDSATPEFTDTNLFSDDRFAGYDRVETGPRFNYGLRSQLYLDQEVSMNGMIGQAWRADNDPLFPISQDPTSHFSDYVGLLALADQPLLLTYRFRLSKDNLAPDRSEINLTSGWPNLSVYLNYLDLKNDPIAGDKEDLSGGFTVKIGKYWSVGLGADRDLLLGQWVGTNAGLVYQNECITVVTSAGHSFTSFQDISQGTTFKMQVFLKNLH